MKRHDGLRARPRGASEAQGENAVGEHPAEVLMDHVISQPYEELEELSGALWIIHLIGIRSAMTGDVDDRAGDTTAP
jgi:hypothetical protein